MVVLQRLRVVVALSSIVCALALAACGGGPSPGSSTGTTSAREPANAATGTTRPLVWSATVTGSWEVNPGFRQGIARVDGGWVFSTNNGLYRTDERGTILIRNESPIPPELTARGYDHIGDIDISGTVLWAPLERDDKASGEQVMARYDAATFAFIGSEIVAQHHNSLVTVDATTVYSTDFFDDDAIVRYQWDGEMLRPLPPLRMSRKVQQIQGADVADGAIWLSTDDDHNGLYRVDLMTGAVADLGSAGYVAGEGEGIDATALPTGLLHTLVIDEKLAPVYVVDAAVTSNRGT